MAPGPKLSLTPKLIGQVCKTIARGNFRYVAFGLEGISKGTWSSWVKRGQKELRKLEAGTLKTDPSLKVDLIRALIKAEARMQCELLENVLECGKNEDEWRHKDRQWKFLLRRFPKEFSRNPNAHTDDEYGDETFEEPKIDASALLASKIQELLDR